jgi:pimeloyl-ACP methyl ester carboxylesterase
MTRAPCPRSPLYARVMGEGPPLVFLHGFGGSSNYWGQSFDGLASRRRLVFVDLAGFGRSLRAGGPYTIDGHVQHLAHCVSRFPGHPVLVGVRPR